MRVACPRARCAATASTSRLVVTASEGARALIFAESLMSLRLVAMLLNLSGVAEDLEAALTSVATGGVMLSTSAPGFNGH